MTDSPPTNIVIVGAGAGGFLLYRRLSVKLAANSNIHLIVIEPRKFVLHHPSSVRMVVTLDDDLKHMSIMDHPTDVNNSENIKFVYAKVTSIVDGEGGRDGGYVTLDNDKRIEYSVLILATGSCWNGPISFGNNKDEVLTSVQSWRTQFKDAQDIILVGGGAVGFELSGELKDQYPDKRITIVHNQPLPLNGRYPDRWRKDVAKKVEKRGIQLVVNEYVDDFKPRDGHISTRAGNSIPADLVVHTFGSRPNTEFVRSLGPDVLSETGFVKVKSTLQLVGHPRIFALGDIIEWEEEKQEQKAMNQVPIVANNVFCLLNGKLNLKEYKGSMEMIALINGRYGGSSYISTLWGIILGDKITSAIKGKSLLVDITKSTLGL